MTTSTKNIFELVNELRRNAFLTSFFYFMTVTTEVGAIITYSESFSGFSWLVLIVALGLTTLVYLVVYHRGNKLTEAILTDVEKEVKRIMGPKPREAGS